MYRSISLIRSFTVFKRFIHSETRIGILGVPFEEGQTKVGVAQAPDVIRKAELVKKLANIRKFL